MLKRLIKKLQQLMDKQSGFVINRSTKRFYSQFVGNRTLAFDVGANVGNRTKLFVELGAKVIAFEPQPDCVELLKQQFKNNVNVVIEPCGLSSKEGQMELMISSVANTISTFSPKWQTARFKEYEWDKRLTVPVYTLDQMIEKYGLPQFCKIDVEGFEKEVLQGLTQPLPYISFEYTYEFVEDANQIMSYIETLGTHKFNITIEEKPVFVFEKWSTKEEVYKYIQTGHQDLWGDVYVKFIK